MCFSNARWERGQAKLSFGNRGLGAPFLGTRQKVSLGDKCVIGPKTVAQLLPGDYCAGDLQQRLQQLEGSGLQLELGSCLRSSPLSRSSSKAESNQTFWLYGS